MKIKDITLSENLHTITMAMENNAGDFDTEDRLLRELLEKVKEMDQALHGDGEREPSVYHTIENDIDDLLNMVGMNYYIRGLKMGARLRRCSAISRITATCCSIDLTDFRSFGSLFSFLQRLRRHAYEKVGTGDLQAFRYTKGITRNVERSFRYEY